jgi:hypothetical protein
MGQLASLQDLYRRNLALAAALAPHSAEYARSLSRCSHPIVSRWGAVGTPVNPNDAPSRHAYYCQSPACLMCRRLKAADARAVLLYRLHCPLPEGSQILFGTFATVNVTTSKLGAHAERLSRAWAKFRRILARLSVCGTYRSLELVTADDPDYENLHVHAVIVAALGISPDKLKDLWYTCAGRIARDANVQAAWSVNRVARYCCKSRPGYYLQNDGRVGIEDPARYVERLRQMRYRQRFRGQGVLETPQTPDDELGRLLYSTRTAYIMSQRRIARFSPIPIEGS